MIQGVGRLVLQLSLGAAFGAGQLLVQLAGAAPAPAACAHNPPFTAAAPAVAAPPAAPEAPVGAGWG